MAKTKPATAKQVDLNRWCIEMAMRWPVHSVGGYGQAAGGIYPPTRSEVDADILGRATKIKAWVQAA